MNQNEGLEKKDIDDALTALKKFEKQNKHRSTVSYSTQLNVDGFTLQKDINKLVNQIKEKDHSKQNLLQSEINLKQVNQNVDLDYINRFEQHSNQKEQWLKQQQQKQEQKRISVLQPVPQISENSKKLISKYQNEVPLYQRLTQIQEQKNKQLEEIQEKMNKELLEKDKKECTFRPNTNNNIKAESRLFEKKTIPQKQEEYYSFKPQINKKSSKIASIFQKSYVEKKLNQSTEKNQKPEKRKQFSFISKKSQQIVKEKFQNVDNKATYLYDNFMKSITTTKRSKSNEKINNINIDQDILGDSHYINQIEAKDKYHSIIEQLKSIKN